MFQNNFTARKLRVLFGEKRRKKKKKIENWEKRK